MREGRARLNLLSVALVLAACQYQAEGLRSRGVGSSTPGTPSNTERPPAPGGPPTPGGPPAPAPGGENPPPPPPMPADAAAPRPPDGPPVRPPDPPPSDAAPEAPPAPLPADAAITTTGSPAACPATPDLALCLRFEGQLTDESPNRLPVTGAGARFAPGAMGQALDARDDIRLLIAETPALDAQTVTLEATVYVRNLGRRMAVAENPGQYSLIILPSGSVMCSGFGGYALRTNGVAPGRWTHLLCTFEPTTTSLSIDGARVVQAPAGPVATDRTAGLRIGWEDEAGRTFDGLIDTLRVWRTSTPPRP